MQTAPGVGKRHATGRWWRGRRAGQAGLATVLAGALVGSALSAEAAPEQILQSVSVDLGSGGSITSVESRTVSRSDGGSEAETTALDPTTAAGELPVRVLTSWRLGERAGTDLADIAGESGRVVVDVTVQNLTVRPDRLEYDANGTQRTQHALVGSPLTVIASADVGDGSLARIITTADGRGDAGVATNGLLSRAEDGSSQVQWAALLAPPRLAPTATFRLVQETEDFQVPDIDLSVQPGLVTDSSVQALLRAAFSEDNGSTLNLESRTIALLAEVNDVLAEAGIALAGVRNGLAGTVGNLGQQTIAELEASTSAVSGSLMGVASSIESLEGDISGQLSTTSAGLSEQLTGTLGAVKALLGDPRTEKAPPSVPAGAACKDIALPAYPQEARDDLSIHQQVLQVHARLAAMSDASDTCAAEIGAGLLKDLGTQEVATCTDASISVTCSIERARNQLTVQAASFADFRDDLEGFYSSPELARLDSQLSGVVGRIAVAQGIVARLPGGDADSVGRVGLRLNQLDRMLEDLLAEIQSVDAASVQEAIDALGTIKGIATTQADDLDRLLAASDPGPLVTAVSDMVRTLCATPAAAAGLPPEVAGYLATAGDTCTDADEVLQDLGDRSGAVWAALVASRDAWRQVAAEAEVPGGAGTVIRDLGALATEVQDVREDLAKIMDDVSDPGTGIINPLTDLVNAVLGLYRPIPTETCPGEGPAVEAPLNALVRSMGNLKCLGSTITEDLDDRYGDLDESVGVLRDDLGKQIERTDLARARAVEDIETMTGKLGDSAGGAGEEIRRSTTRAVLDSRRQIDAGAAGFGRNMDRAVTRVLDQIGGTVGAANRDLLGAEKQLRRDLQAVLLDLGDPERGTGGILGALRSSASQTGLSTRKVAYANNRAARFAGLRTSALEDVYLQRAQLSRSLAMQSELAPLGIDLPEGSSVLTVYSFHLSEA